MSDWRVNFPVVPYKTDISGNVIETDIVETLTIMNGYIKLSQVPVYSQEPGRQIVIDGYHEVYNDPKNPADFRVNYLTGRVYFHDSQEGGMATCRYKGLGSLVAIDEINWLWEQTKKNTSFVGLIDTPDYLMPRSYFRVDSVGKTIEMVSPTVGRSYSEIYMFPVGTERPMKLHGSAYDVIHVYKPIESELENVQHLLVFDSADVIAKDGKYAVANPTENKEVTVHSTEYDTAGLVALNKIALGGEDIPSGAALRVMLDFDGAVYIVQDGLLQYIGSSAVTIATQGNLPSELANLTPEALAKVRGKRLSFWLYFKCGPKVTVPGIDGAPDTEVVYSPSVDSSAVLTVELGGGLQEIPFLGKFDYVTESWTLDTSPYESACVVTVGTGRDDVIVTSDRLDFPKVAPGESVQIYAPTRTSVQVLKGEEVEFETIEYPALGAASFSHAKAYSGDTAFIANKVFCEQIPDAKNVLKFPDTENMIAWYDMMDTSYENKAPGKAAADTHLQFLGGGTSAHDVDVGCFGPAMRFDGPMYARLHSQEFPWGSRYSSLNYYVTTAAYAIGGFVKNVRNKNGYLFSPYYTSGGDLRAEYIYRNNSGIYAMRRNHPNSGQIGNVGYVEHAANDWTLVVATNYKGFGDNRGSYFQMYVDDNGIAGSCGAHNVLYMTKCHNCIGWYSADTAAASIFDIVFAYKKNLTQNEIYTIHDIMKQREQMYANNEYVFLVANKPMPKSANGEWFNTLMLPQSWMKNKDNERYLFKKGDRFYTLDRTTLKVQEVSIYQLGSLLWNRCADLSMLQTASPEITRQLFAETQLVIMTLREGGAGTMAGCADHYILQGYGLANMWHLAQTGKDVEIKYINDSWYVKNIGAGNAELRVLIMGGTKLIGGGGGAQLFTELADTPDSLMDTAPQALVSLNGEVVKRLYLHPYLRGEA